MTYKLPTTAPMERSLWLPGVDASRWPTFGTNWATASEHLRKLRETIEAGKDEFLPGVRMIAACGSLGRMEASSLSDADLVIVVKDGLTEHEREVVFDSVWSAIVKRMPDIEKPKATGLFSQATSLELMCPPVSGGAEHSVAYGDHASSVFDFGKRLLLLLESQPVYGDIEYKAIVNRIVDGYAHGFVARDSRKEWALLLNDVMRYFRQVCVNYHYDFVQENWKWPIRNIKLRHSRLLMYAGLVSLLGECSKERQHKVEWLKERLVLTPLERLAYVYHENMDTCFHRICGTYSIFLGRLSNKDIREMLNSKTKPIDYADRDLNSTFSELKANSDSLVAELLRFLRAREGQWTERFYEYLLF